MANAHIGRVETIEGGVTVTPLSGSESPLTQGMPVYMNDLIKTDADASVRLRLHDGSSLLIDAGQTISLDTNLVDVSATGILISEDSVTAITVTGITTISSVDGKVQVVRDGVPRELVAGDLLYPGDTLIAAADGSATLQLSDGSETVIEPGSQSRLGGSNAAQQEGEFLTSGIDDPAEIQAAILAGRDPSQDAPAPGVGETESNEGHTHIRILPSGRAVTPDSGHETHGQDLPISFDIEELLQDQDSIPDLNVTYIAGGPGVVDEAGLPNGSSSNDGSAATSGSFTIDTGNDQLAAFEVQDKDGTWIDVTAGNVMVQGVNGVLTVTLNNGVYDWSYDLTTNLTTHTDTDTLDGDSDRGAADQVPGDMFPVRVIDNDGDISPPASIDIVVNDDGPSVTSTALPVDALQVDESLLTQDAQLDVSGQFAIVAGADQPAAVSYALSVPGGAGADSGLVDVATGQRILLSEVNGVIQGRTETGGDLVFTLSVDGAGVVTLDQLRALRHPDGTDPDDVLNLESPDLVQLTATVTDADGDTASANLNLGSAISFRDDGPSLTGGILGEFYEGGDPQVLGPVGSILNISPGADGLQSIDITNSNPLGGTLEVINGQLVYTPPADVDNGPEGNAVQLDNFQISVTDGDGDSATTQVSFEVVGPNLAIGSGADDEGPDDGIDPHVLNTTPVASGAIIGDAGVDFIAGDPGGTASIDTNANMILVLDISGSMRTSINFTDSNGVTSSMSRLDAQKLAVIALLTEMANSGAAEVRVHIVGFSSDASALGTFNLVGGDLQSAIDAVNATTAGGVTNYEAGLQAAIEWSAVSGNLLSGDNVINQAFFVSDGKPNRYLNDDGSLSGSASASTAMGQILGSDGTNEVQILENQFGPIEAIGIALTRQSDINNLDQVEGEARNSDVADNIFTANDLVDALSDLNPLNQLAPLGNDVINAGDGNDIVFGDSLFTDILADNQGLATPDGTGWRVFAELEATPGWGREETTDYIRANHVELSAESTLDAVGRAGGNDIIDAGAGDDIVYGQEGDDIITGGAGNDILSGGSGADIFIWTANESGSDEIIDFNTTEGDVLNIADLLTGQNNLTAAEPDSSYMSIASGSDTVITVFGSGGNTDQVIQLTGFDTTGQSSVQIIENLLGNNLLTD